MWTVAGFRNCLLLEIPSAGQVKFAVLLILTTMEYTLQLRATCCKVLITKGVAMLLSLTLCRDWASLTEVGLFILIASFD